MLRVSSIVIAAICFAAPLFSQQNVSNRKQQASTQPFEEIQISLKDRNAVERTSAGKFLRFRTASFRAVMTKFSLSDSDIQAAYPDYNDPAPYKDTAFFVQHPHGYTYVSSNNESKSFVVRLYQKQNVDSVVSALRQLPEVSGAGQKPKNPMAIDEQVIPIK